ncbi:MAG: magnesium and cobalt transport protein CorA [Deltaproteobacteria bacterium]|nr:MAG: magnesium and cobalt transport protein CorA [Deltaproteobacteria bacterium]
MAKPNKRRRRRRRARIVVPRRAVRGAPPGVLDPPANAPRPRIALIEYGPDGASERAVESIAELAAPAPSAAVRWINIDGVGDADVFAALGDAFHLHPLALEDAVHVHQRPKVDDYGDHIYFVARMPAGEEPLVLEQISVFVGRGFAITVQEHPGDCLDPVRERIRGARGRIRGAGPDYLLYAVVDAIMDAYFPIVDRLNVRLEQIEERVLLSPGDGVVAEVHAIRHDLHLLRRTLTASREALGALVRRDSDLVGDDTRAFLRDCQDHVDQLLDAVEACRELSASLMDLHASAVANRMNEVMKVLTLIATIFIPLSFIAGVYGMNFDRSASPWNMPELGWRYGYPLALAAMLATALAFLWFFWRRGWLSLRRDRPPRDDADGA